MSVSLPGWLRWAKQQRALKNRQGIGPITTVMWIPKILFLVIVFIVAIILIREFLVTGIDVFEPEAATFINSFLYSPHGLSYRDPGTGRVYPGIIDIQRFNAENVAHSLDRAFSFGKENNHVAAQFRLKSVSGTEETIVYYNQAKYEYWSTLAKAFGNSAYVGPGGAREKKQQLYVLARTKDGTLEQKILEISVVIPND
ncbi:hypothetical protein HYW21_03400 [Candidatus Woesearchaeota archaeon]|nr:hypothetical protein [Candidatus Woesearchaeota archaeon]